jgi:hypothetical protein
MHGNAMRRVRAQLGERSSPIRIGQRGNGLDGKRLGRVPVRRASVAMMLV